ncbi:hypothetical protein [Micromonospora sp. NBC_01412]|uniref:hypothetical protein n=1 Tax=Micromonospora sp. NBC_01412 TaxID=2903590 RepID=UPI00386EBD2B
MSGYGVSLAELRRHVAARPTWRCRVCAAPWPCQPAKLGLRTEYARDRVALAIYLCVLMHDAIADRLRTHPDQVDPTGYFDRFIAWTRPWPPPAPSPPADDRPDLHQTLDTYRSQAPVSVQDSARVPPGTGGRADGAAP